jgi:MFS family permease
VRSDAVIGTLLPLEAIFSLFGSFNPLIVVLAREVYHVGAEGFGLLQSAAGIGTVAGSVLLAVMGDVRQKGRLMIAAAMVYGASVIGFAFCPFYPLAVVLLALSGAADFIRGTARTTTLQLFARGPMLGRVMSLDGMATRGLGQMGGFTAGSMSELMGTSWALSVGALICMGATLGVAWRNEQVRNLTDAPLDVSTTSARV